MKEKVYECTHANCDVGLFHDSMIYVVFSNCSCYTTNLVIYIYTHTYIMHYNQEESVNLNESVD